MSYSIGTEYYLVWLTNDEDVNALLAQLLPGYGFTLDSEHGCYYISADNFDEWAFLEAMEGKGLYDIDANYWEFLYSYQIPHHL